MPKNLVLQWHITERCNLRCLHCYQDSYSGGELNFKKLLEILHQFKELLHLWAPSKRKLLFRGHINVTGGEPFIRHDFLDLLEVFSKHKDDFTFSILTNGSLIDSKIARRLYVLKPVFVQVSVDGSQSTHDKIRGHGEFKKTVSAIKELVRNRLRTFISFTAHRENFKEFPEISKLGRKLKVSKVWADRFIPWGNGSDMKELVLNPMETQEFFEIMKKARNKAFRYWFSRTEIAMKRALQFLITDGEPYHCTAGDSLITVQPNGDLYPCRRMPIHVGNLMETPLIKLYYESDIFNSLRDRYHISDGCQNCSFSNQCRGGLKCLSYATTGNLFKADPGCWLASHS